MSIGPDVRPDGVGMVWLSEDADLMELLYGMACNARDAVNREGGKLAEDWDGAFVRARDQYHQWLHRWLTAVPR